MTFVLAFALAALALTGVGPTLTLPVVVWMKPLNIGPYWSFSISVGTTGVYVAGGNQLRRYDFDGSMVWTRQTGAFHPLS